MLELLQGCRICLKLIPKCFKVAQAAFKEDWMKAEINFIMTSAAVHAFGQ